jgi:hypothetical protein
MCEFIFLFSIDLQVRIYKCRFTSADLQVRIYKCVFTSADLQVRSHDPTLYMERIVCHSGYVSRYCGTSEANFIFSGHCEKGIAFEVDDGLFSTSIKPSSLLRIPFPRLRDRNFHAHSNWSADCQSGKPDIRTARSHERPCVALAPPTNCPLCCRSLRSGLTVAPIYVRSRAADTNI